MILNQGKNKRSCKKSQNLLHSAKMCYCQLIPTLPSTFKFKLPGFSDKVGAWFAANQIRKTYLARVKGSFKKLMETEISGVFRAKTKTVEGGAREVVMFFV